MLFRRTLPLGGFGGTGLVDPGALGGARQGRRERAYPAIRARLRTPPRAAQRGRAAQCLFRQTLLTLGLVALVAACGPTQGPPDDFYEVEPTRECLKDAGFRITTSLKEVGFITWTASAGGFRAYLPEDRNSLTIAFGNTKEEAQRMVTAFQTQARTRQEKRRLRSLLEGQGNAVLVWISEPTLEEQELVRGCLK